MFQRTRHGISNEFLFYDVDLVVYCEGSGHDGEYATIDEAFWSKIFTENGKRVKCKSIGGKSDVLQRAALILSERLPNVAVALDRDYDHFTGAMVQDPQVFYTFGYSWESDVMLDFNFHSALSLFAEFKNPHTVKEDFERYRAQQSDDLRRVFALDLKYIGHPQKLFDRANPLSIIKTGGKGAPRINVKRLLEQAKTLGRYQTTTLPAQLYTDACGVRSFCGKAIAHLFYRWFVFRAAVIPKKGRVPYEAFVGNLVSTLSLKDPQCERNRYYTELVGKLNCSQ